MNYRLRSIMLNWLFDSCQGSGCINGGKFEDNDSNLQSTLGPIQGFNETEFDLSTKSIQEDYPEQVWRSTANSLSTHDTARVLFLLKKISKDDPELARRKFAFINLFLFTYPGAPMVYYGDEVGLGPDSVWDGSRWQDDPYNRAVYPWPDQGMSINQDLLDLHKKLAKIRADNPVFKAGGYTSIIADNQKRVFAFVRSLDEQKALVVLNRNGASQSLEIEVAGQLADQMRFKDLLSGKSFKVENGKINLGQVSGLWGAILVKE